MTEPARIDEYLVRLWALLHYEDLVRAVRARVELDSDVLPIVLDMPDVSKVQR